jgi:hypothetical protein
MDKANNTGIKRNLPTSRNIISRADDKTTPRKFGYVSFDSFILIYICLY